MKILLIGYGKMGQLIENLASEHGMEIRGVITRSNINELDERWTGQIDCAIEFTTPDAVVANLKKCMKLGIPVVTGTTGWQEASAEIFALNKMHNGALFYASNFSIGANIFFLVNQFLAKLMARNEHYQLTIEETHHLQKKDSPSGTAITLADDIIDLSEKTKWVNKSTSETNSIGIISHREAGVTGTHIVQYDSNIDKIEIVHQAKNRQGFALGAISAAAFLHNRKGIFTMRDLIENNK